MQRRYRDSNEMRPYEVPLTGLPNPSGGARHWYVPASDRTVHWGYFSKSLAPIIEIDSGDYVTLECLTHQAGDDPARLLRGDAGAESVYHWTAQRKNVDRRGAGPMDAANGAGGGQGVHILTGPVCVRGARPGDLLEVRIIDMYPRPCANPAYADRVFGTNLAANWGYHYLDLMEEPRPREVVTIYEIETTSGREFARPLYNYRWGPVTDPNGVIHRVYDYPGLIADPEMQRPQRDILRNVRVPIRPHFGTLGLAPKEADLVSSIPPNYTGGNVDDWRIGKGATIYYPVSVEGALLSAGDTHAAQGDSELCGTAIESSWTGLFQVILHARRDVPDRSLLAQVQWPLLETRDEWVVHGFSHPHYLTDLGEHAQRDVFMKSSVDLAMRDAFRKMRGFLMHAHRMSEDEAISLMSVAVDFGITQVVDGNWGVHASLKKSIFTDYGASP